MSATSARAELASFIVKMLEIGAAIDSNPPVIRSQRGAAVVVWSSAPSHAIRPRSTPFASIADYRRLLEDRQYNLVLSDGSLLQVLLVFRHDTLAKHSFCYYPCPVQFLAEPFEPPNVGELVDLQLFHALETSEWLPSELLDLQGNPDWASQEIHHEDFALRMRAPLRFDFDPEAATPSHPMSHLHLGEAECRIPVSAPLSIGAFLRFVFHHFYPSLWQSAAFLQTWPTRAPDRCISHEHELDIFLDWRS